MVVLGESEPPTITHQMLPPPAGFLRRLLRSEEETCPFFYEGARSSTDDPSLLKAGVTRIEMGGGGGRGSVFKTFLTLSRLYNQASSLPNKATYTYVVLYRYRMQLCMRILGFFFLVNLMIHI